MSSNFSSRQYLSDRRASLDALKCFGTEVLAYEQNRNLVVEGHPHVSRLSEAIKARLISEYEVVSRILQQCAFPRLEKYIQEVYWRLYWKGWLEWHPGVWADYRSELSQIQQTASNDQQAACLKVQEGNSGVKIMDRFAQELVTTGYLHNHARMWFAGYWIHVCGLPWQCGAHFFYQHLLDADAASNTLSWRWVAGLQTQGKTYLPRDSNIRKYCRYPEASEPLLQQQLQPLESIAPESNFQKPQRLPQWEETQIPVIDEPYVMWIHGDDLSFWEDPQNLPQQAPKAAVMVRDDQLAAAFEISELRSQFMGQVFEDARSRFESKFGTEVEVRTGALVEELLGAAKANEVTVVAGILPAVGPLRSHVAEIRQILEQHGIRLELWRRPKDELVLPLASKGFFPFWKSIRSQWE